MSTNIPLGSYLADGVRTGPFYSGQISNNVVANNDGVITSGSHSQYGPGILLSSQNTYRITPAPFNPVGGFTSLTNLVATTVSGAVPAAGNLTLRGDNSVTFNNGSFVKFDWPRIVTVTITGAAATAGTRVTIFGTDWYNMPMQHTYVVQAQQTYPVIDLAAHTVSLPAKAFYTVNRVHIGAGLPVNSLISLGAADAYGLPYALTVDDGDIVAVRYGALGAALSEFTTAGGSGDPLILKGAFVPAATNNPATAITGDVRGFYATSAIADGTKSLSFTASYLGADAWINQVANMQQLYMQNSGSPTPQGVVVPPLSPADLYGRAQFYTGVPS